MQQKTIREALLAALLVLAAGPARAEPPRLSLTLQTRDPKTGQVMVTTGQVDAARVAVVVVDPWNFHWCKTATMRVDALIPRMNRALEAARSLGMTVMLCPSDVVDNYAGWPQRELVIAMPKHPLPPLAAVNCPAPPDGGGCACGGERCVVNYGWDGMHPDLHIGKTDLMPDTLQEVWTICKDRQLTHLIYMGVHTQVCLLGKSMGLRNLKAAGMQCILARDITDAHPGYNPAAGFTPDGHTAEVVAHFERYLAPTINMAEELAKIGKWDQAWVVDPVRIAPWGTAMRPHLFEKEITVTLCAPWQPKAEIRYTTDGTEPGPQSTKYERPLKVNATARLRVAAFDGGNRVCLESEGVFHKLIAMPPQPDVHLSDLTPLRAVGPGHTYGNNVRFAAHSNPPQKDKSNEGHALQLRGVKYSKGMGVHATNQMIFELKPEYERFVALVGVDEHILAVSNGSNLAMHPSVVFKVFMDGNEAAASPLMRIGLGPWRFDVKIPPGSRIISLTTMDGGNGNKEDRANWVHCGFVLKEGEAKAKLRAAREHGPWKAIHVPAYWEQAPGGQWADYDGLAWYRSCVKVPKSWAGKDGTRHVECVNNRHEAIELRGDREFRTGDDAAWAQKRAGSQPPGFARFEKTAPAAAVPRKGETGT